MSAKQHFNDLITYLTSAAFSASVLAFSMDILKALSLGIVGGFAGMLGRWIWYQIFPKTKSNGRN